MQKRPDVQVAAGEAYSVAVSWKGEAFTWGWGFGDLLGHGDTESRLKPTPVSLPEDTLAGEETMAQPEEGEGEGAALRNIQHGEHGGRMTNHREATTEGGAPVVDRVTCAAAGDCFTMLGTRAGRVLVSGQRASEGYSTDTLRGFYEYGRLPDRRQQCRWIDQPQAFPSHVPVALVVDSPGGQLHAFTDGAHDMNPYVVGRASEPRQIRQGAGASLASQEPQAPRAPTRTPHAPQLKRAAEVATFDGEGEPLPTPSPSPASPPRQPPRQPPATTKFSTVTISVGDRRGDTGTGELSVFALDGEPGWGIWDAFVAVSTEGALLTAGVTGTDSLRERRGDGVVCALTWLEMDVGDSRSLLMVDGGKRLMTSGHGRTGHVSGRTTADAHLFIRGAGVNCKGDTPAGA